MNSQQNETFLLGASCSFWSVIDFCWKLIAGFKLVIGLTRYLHQMLGKEQQNYYFTATLFFYICAIGKIIVIFLTAAIEANNDMYCLRKRMEKFPLPSSDQKSDNFNMNQSSLLWQF